jgi:hypothetical protein
MPHTPSTLNSEVSTSPDAGYASAGRMSVTKKIDKYIVFIKDFICLSF